MEERKLIKLGNSSFAIALPKEWIDKSKLKKGDKIFLEHNENGEITVSSKFKKEEEKKIEINLTDKDRDSIKHHLRAAYIKGYNTVIFKGDPKNKRIIEDLLKDYLSFEIMESSPTEVTTKDFFDMKEVKFENLVRRIDNCLREMFDITMTELKREKPNPQSLREMKETDAAVNKFYFLCSRIFSKGIDNPAMLNTLKMSGNRLFNNWWIAFNLESLGDGLKYFLQRTSKTTSKNKQAIYEIITRLQQEYILCMEAFYSEDSEKAFKVAEETRKIRASIENLKEEDPKTLHALEALKLVEKNIYQNSKITFYIKY